MRLSNPTRTQIKYATHIRHACGQIGGSLVKQVETGYQGAALAVVLCRYGVELILYGPGIHIVLSFLNKADRVTAVLQFFRRPLCLQIMMRRHTDIPYDRIIHQQEKPFSNS